MTPSPWTYFTEEELSCHCLDCDFGPEKMDDQFMTNLVALRAECNFPFPFTSAIRCPQHNMNESSTGPNGPHTTGRAVDIAVNRGRARILMANADAIRFPGLGVQQKGVKRFIHLDGLDIRTWSY